MGNKSRRTFVKIFLSYISFMTIPFVAIGYIYFASIKSISDSSKADSYNMLFQVKNMVDVRLKEVVTISRYISKNPDLIKVLKYDRDYVRDNLLDVYKLCNSIPRFQVSNSIIDDIYMLSKNSRLVVSPGSACEYTQNLHNSLFPEISYNYNEWNDFLWNNRLPDNYVILKNSSSNTHSNLVYLRGLPDALSSSHPGALYISIRNSFFTDMLKQVDTGKKGMVCIIDNKETIISSFKGEGFSLDLKSVFSHLSGQTSDTNLDGYIINSVKSDINSWTYYSIIPKKVILSQVSHVRNIIIFLTLIAFLAGCIIAYKLASQKAVVLRRIIGYLSDAPAPETTNAAKNHNEYQYIEYAVANLISDNQNLSERLHKQRDTIKNSMMRTLIFGDFYDTNELKNILDNYSFDFRDKQYAVISISIIYNAADKNTTADDNYGIIHLFFKEIAEQLSDNQMYIIDIDDKTIAAVIFFDASLSKSECQKFIDTIAQSAYSECLARYNATLKSGVSLICNNISKIHKAYEQSMQALEYLLKSSCDSFIMHGNHQLLQTDLYYYPIEVELKLIQLVKYGDIDLLEDLLKEIYEENFKNRNLSQAMKKQLVFAMRGTIIRGLRNIVPNSNINEMINELDTAVSMEDIFSYANHISMEICRIVAAKRNEDDEKLAKDIFAYIEDSYSDNNFCIRSIADRFNFSENAVYQYFRENIGIPFSTVLENKRIEKACELIRDTDMQIKDIALNVGYNNDISFRRAFKRVMGILPMEYEKTIKVR